jgi:hypothetical protein
MLFLLNQEFNRLGNIYQEEKIRRQLKKGCKPDVIDLWKQTKDK